MSSARNYWTHEQLRDDAKTNRRLETLTRLRAHSEWEPTQTLRDANTYKLRAEASETILRNRDKYEQCS